MAMSKGPHRQILDRYLDTAQEGILRGAGRDWKKKAEALQVLADAMKAGAEQAELRIGAQSLTGPAIRKGMEDTALSIGTKSGQLVAAGEALVQVGTQLSDTREARDLMKDLGEKPSPYQPPAGTGVPLTSDEINAQAADSAVRQGERTSWQDAFDRQEARSLTLTKQMDSAFLGAIPPMQAIHGQDDPTEPPPNVPSGPGGPLLPGTQVPGGGGGGGNDDKPRVFWQPDPKDPDPKDPDPKDPDPKDPDPKDPDPKDPDPKDPDPKDPDPTHGDPPGPQLDPTHHDPHTPTTSVIGTSQTGISYNPGGGSVAAPVSAPASPGMSTGAAMGAAGMAGGAGAAGMAGAVRGGGSAPAASGRSAGTPARAIGSTGRSGSASALSRSAGNGAARPAASGGASGTRAGSAGSAAGRSAGSGARGAGSAGAGSRPAGAGGSRGAGGRGAAGSAAGGRGGRKGDRDATTDRDSLVYDQDWLGDDEVAPGVLD